MTFWETFNDWTKYTVVISRTSNTSDGMGGNTENNVSIASFSGAVWQNSAAGILNSGRESDLSSHTIACKVSNVSGVVPSDIATIENENYRIDRVDNVLGLGDIAYIQAELIS